MIEQESIDARLARIEEHVKNIDMLLAKRYVCCRHVNADGECDFYEDIQDHDRRINQWTGALAAVSLLCSLFGALIGVLLSKIWK